MKKTFLFITLATFLMVSCSKLNQTIEDDGGANWDEIMNSLNVADDFHYLSTKEVDLIVTLPFTVDFSNINSRISIYDKSPTEGGVLLYVGSADENGVFNQDITIPAYLTELYLSTMAGDQLITLDTGAQSLKGLKTDGYNFGANYYTLPPKDTTAENKSQSIENNRFNDLVYRDRNFASSQNIISNGNFDSDDFGSQQNWSSAMTVDGRWNITSQLNGVVEQFNDNGENVLRIARPSSYRYGGVTQLLNASPGDLITFTADHKVSGNDYKRSWMYLIPRNSNGSPLAYYSRYIYSTSTNWNTYTVTATMPANTASVQVLLWHHIYGDYIYWDNVVVTGPVADADGDGVNDEEDDYPDDATRAYNIYYPNSEDYASLAFEDNWPGKGDYDFNDLVVDYQFKQVANADNELVELESKFIIRAIGASFTNGFGFEMNLEPSDIASVTGTSIVDNYINLLGNNTEAGQNNGTIIVTDNAFTQLPHPGGGTGVNTTPGQTYVEPNTMTVMTTLANPVSLSQLGSPPYNPFIIVNQIRGREVHLSDHLPTTLADQSYFGTEHDDSNVATGKYYKTDNNLPWAINVPNQFDYPVEKAYVIQAYLHFVAWAESSGTQFPNWYVDEAGYRNEGVIY